MAIAPSLAPRFFVPAMSASPSLCADIPGDIPWQPLACPALRQWNGSPLKMPRAHAARAWRGSQRYRDNNEWNSLATIAAWS